MDELVKQGIFDEEDVAKIELFRENGYCREVSGNEQEIDEVIDAMNAYLALVQFAGDKDDLSECYEHFVRGRDVHGILRDEDVSNILWLLEDVLGWTFTPNGERRATCRRRK